MVLILMVLVIGCSGGDPVAVSSVPGVTAQDAPVITNRALWGFWNVTIDVNDGSVETVPLRTAEFTANVNNLLDANPGNLLIEDLDLTDYFSEGRIDCTVRLRHPFPGLDMYNGFDVWGVFMHNGSTPVGYDDLYYSDGSGTNEAVLLNPDGYTRWFNMVEFDGGGIPLLGYWPGKLGNLPAPSATLNPFKIFADGLDTEEEYYEWINVESNYIDRSIFTAGNVNARRYMLDFPLIDDVPKVDFQYVVIATWEEGDPESTGNPDFYEPADFPTSANVEEAFFVNIDTTDSDLYYEDETVNGGTLRADVEVFDWQGGTVGNTGVVNEIEKMILIGDFITAGTAEFLPGDLEMIATGGSANSSVFEVEISGCIPTASGDTGFWVVVEAAGMNGSSYDQGFPVAYPDSPRASFMTGNVTILDESPVTDVTVTAIDPDSVPFWSTVDDATITGLNFMDGYGVQLEMDGEDPVVATDVQFIDSTTITCDFDLWQVNSGSWDVVVNPGANQGVLTGGFTIEEWSDEYEIASGMYRLPNMVEMYSGKLLLAYGQSDSSMRYSLFDADNDGWNTPGLLSNAGGNGIVTPLAADRYNDYAFTMTTPSVSYRYDGTTDSWATGYQPVHGNRCARLYIDNQSRFHLYNGTASSFGFITHSRAPNWPINSLSDFDIHMNYFPDAVNSLYLTAGNVMCNASNDTIFTIYCKDNSMSPYLGYPPNGPRYIRMTATLFGNMASGYTTIEQVYGANIALDSPAIDIDSNEYLHAAYRIYDTGSTDWHIRYEYSTNNGSSFTPGANIWEGSAEPLEDYVFIYTDSGDNLHAVYGSAGQFEYKNMTDGSTWSDFEIADEDKPSGDDDFHPRAFVDSNDILHMVWVRGTESAGYGTLVHRMRDLL